MRGATEGRVAVGNRRAEGREHAAQAVVVCWPLALALLLRGAAAAPGWAGLPAVSWALATYGPVLALAGGTAWLVRRSRGLLPLRVLRGQATLLCMGGRVPGSGGRTGRRADTGECASAGRGAGGLGLWPGPSLGWGVAAPLVEEAYFRGAVFGTATAAGGAALGVAASALAFGLAHWGSPETLVWVGVGVALGILRQISGSLLPPMALHLAWNAASLALALQPRLGSVALPSAVLGGSATGGRRALAVQERTLQVRCFAPDYEESLGDRVLLIWGDLPFWVVVDQEAAEFIRALAAGGSPPGARGASRRRAAFAAPRRGVQRPPRETGAGSASRASH